MSVSMHAFPSVAIHSDSNDLNPMEVIAAGIGAWPVQAIATTISAQSDPTDARNRLAVAIVTAATGLDFESMTMWRDKPFPYHTNGERAAIAKHYFAAIDLVTNVLRDLPEPVFARVAGEIGNCQPDHALTLIRAIHNVIHALSVGPIPAHLTLSPEPDALFAAAAD